MGSERGYVAGPAVLVEGRAVLALAVFLKRHQAGWEAAAAEVAVRGDLGTATLFDRIVRAAEVLSGRAAQQAGLPPAEARGLPHPETSTSSGSMTADQAADRLDVSSTRVRQLCRAGVLDGTLVAGRWVINPVSVEARCTPS